jgi:FkbM family methyltransferase
MRLMAMSYRLARERFLQFAAGRGTNAKRLYRFCSVFSEAFENSSKKIGENGEEFFLSAVGTVMKEATVFDVGANVGDWALTAQSYLPDARIHCFEPVPATFAALSARRDLKASLHCMALSDKAGKGSMSVDPNDSAVASLSSSDTMDGSPATLTVECLVTTGEEFCRENRIGRIDLLKIDAEGWDYFVLKGFGAMLRDSSIDVVQIEHNEMALRTRVFVRDFFDLLGKDYRICQLHPGGLRPMEPTPAEEHYRMRNLIAYRRGSPLASRLEAMWIH